MRKKSEVLEKIDSLLKKCWTNPKNEYVQESILQFYSDKVIEKFFNYGFEGASGKWSVERAESELLDIIISFIRVDIGYKYPIYNVDSALRIYFCYFRRDWFSYYYLGSDKLLHQNKWRNNFDKKAHLQIAPRDHGKSHVYSLELPVYKICYVDNIRILMSSKTNALANKYLFAIRSVIETNKKIREDFGDLRANYNFLTGISKKAKGSWSNTMLYCRRSGRGLMMKDPTVESVGWGSSITGSRFELICLDDPIEEEDCRTELNRQRQREALDKLQDLLEDNGQFLVVGTRKHYKDLYGYIMESEGWSVSVDKAIIKWPSRYEYIYEKDEMGRNVVTDVKVYGGYEVLCPQKWSIEKLLILKSKELPHVFMRERQGEVTSEEGALFKREWVRACRDVEKFGYSLPMSITHHERNLRKVVGCDFSAVFDKKRAKERDTDYTVYSVLGLDESYNRHLIYLYRDRGMHPREQIRKLVEIYEDFDPLFFVVESNVFQAIYALVLEEQRLPIKRHHTGSEKYTLDMGIPQLAVEIMNGYFVFYTGDNLGRQMYEELEKEFHGYGSESHDDIVMSVWLADIGCRWLINADRAKKRRVERARVRRRRLGKLTEKDIREEQVERVVESELDSTLLAKEILKRYEEMVESGKKKKPIQLLP